jgi:hypothetical protein
VWFPLWTFDSAFPYPTLGSRTDFGEHSAKLFSLETQRRRRFHDEMLQNSTGPRGIAVAGLLSR